MWLNAEATTLLKPLTSGEHSPQLPSWAAPVWISTGYQWCLVLQTWQAHVRAIPSLHAQACSGTQSPILLPSSMKKVGERRKGEPYTERDTAHHHATNFSELMPKQPSELMLKQEIHIWPFLNPPTTMEPAKVVTMQFISPKSRPQICWMEGEKPYTAVCQFCHMGKILSSRQTSLTITLAPGIVKDLAH